MCLLIDWSVDWLIDWLIMFVVSFSVLSAELLLQFFTFYASFPFTNHVMSCFSGEVIPIESFPMPEDGFKLRYVNLQDPFDLAHNIAKSVGLPTFTAFREFLRQEVCVFSRIPLDLVVLFNIDYTAPDLPPSPVMVSISASRKFPVKEDSSWGPKVADLTQKMLLEFFRCEFVREISAEDFGEQKGSSFRYWICFKFSTVVECVVYSWLMLVFAFSLDFTVMILLTYLVQWIIYFLFYSQGLFPSAAAFISWARLWEISTAGWSVGAGPNDVTFANNWPKTCNSPRSRRSGTWKWPSENASIRLPIKAAPLISTSPSWSTRWKRKKCAFRCRARSKRIPLRELSSRLTHCIALIVWLIRCVFFALLIQGVFWYFVEIFAGSNATLSENGWTHHTGSDQWRRPIRHKSGVKQSDNHGESRWFGRERLIYCWFFISMLKRTLNTHFCVFVVCLLACFSK